MDDFVDDVTKVRLKEKEEKQKYFYIIFVRLSLGPSEKPKI